jgi:hypothetical protein
MNRYLISIPLTLFILSILAACAPFKFTDKKAGICNELNSEMIFNGNTSDTRAAEIQGAEQPLVQRTFRNDNCET